MTMTLQVLHVPNCPNLQPLLARLRTVTDLPVTTREITTEAEAVAAGMTGSPTLMIGGVDPFAAADGCACGMSCRLYRDEYGRVVPAPSAAQLRQALVDATAAPTTSATVVAPAGDRVGDQGAPGEVLSSWRTRTRPLDPVATAVQQAILRSFASSGRPPEPGELDAVTTSAGRTAAEVLAMLHMLDAVRLAPDGRIAVAYPFSVAPTRHRVRIYDHTTHHPDGHTGHVDVYAMCAIDALGMPAMLGVDVRIDSIDVTTGHPVTVTTGGHRRWDPPEAVVFVGADPHGGPSVDCCCDYLNFFTDRQTATAWMSAHPQVPGQILTQAEAEDLGARLFGPLLRTD